MTETTSKEDIGFPSHVCYGSLEHTCLHEAGHLYVAKFLRAQVVEVEIFEGPPPTGRTRCCNDEEQGAIIALGGYAAELIFYRGGRLLNESSEAMTDKEFIDLVQGGLELDKIRALTDLRDDQGKWPADADERFMDTAATLANTMKISDIARIASILLAERKLDRERIALIPLTLA